MRKNLIKCLSALFAAVMLFSSVGGIGASASHEAMPSSATEAASERSYLSEKTISSRNILSYPKVALSLLGRTASSDARRINGEVYISLRSFLTEIGGMTVSYNSKTRVLSASGRGLTLSVHDGDRYINANGRILYSPTPSVIMTNGRMYAPLSLIAKAFSLKYTSLTWTSARVAGDIRAITSGESFYREDEVYWLSRIISAESRGEPFLGQIAVGNVVLNRTRASEYPNTIWGVVFDKKWGIQFSPVANGTIYNAPTESAVRAAKICLEGYSVSGEALFFISPRLAHSSWIPQSRRYLFSIQNHDFYA